VFIRSFSQHAFHSGNTNLVNVWILAQSLRYLTLWYAFLLCINYHWPCYRVLLMSPVMCVSDSRVSRIPMSLTVVDLWMQPSAGYRVWAVDGWSPAFPHTSYFVCMLIYWTTWRLLELEWFREWVVGDGLVWVICCLCPHCTRNLLMKWCSLVKYWTSALRPRHIRQ